MNILNHIISLVLKYRYFTTEVLLIRIRKESKRVLAAVHSH